VTFLRGRKPHWEGDFLALGVRVRPAPDEVFGARFKLVVGLAREPHDAHSAEVDAGALLEVLYDAGGIHSSDEQKADTFRVAMFVDHLDAARVHASESFSPQGRGLRPCW
jgi:hypothetical protein